MVSFFLTINPMGAYPSLKIKLGSDNEDKNGENDENEVTAE